MAARSQAPFGTLLRYFRLAAGVSQEALAERAGLSAKTIAALETGARKAPYQRTVAMISDALLLPKKARERLAAAALRPYRPRAVGPVGIARPRHNLPTQLSSFVGRNDVVAEVMALVGDQRLVTLTGTGGIGKTRIALQVAEHHVSRWNDGVWFVISRRSTIRSASPSERRRRSASTRPTRGVLPRRLPTPCADATPS